MKNINAFIKIYNIKNYIFLIGCMLICAGMLIAIVTILNFINPIENVTESKLSNLRFFNTATICVILLLTISCLMSLRRIETDFESTKNFLKTNNMKKFLDYYDEAMRLKTNTTTNSMLLGLALLFYFFFLMNYISIFTSNLLYIEVPLWAKTVSLTIIISNIAVCLIFYKKILVESIRLKKEFNETFNEENFSIGLHKRYELVSAHSMSELLEYIKDGYSYDENFVKQILFD